MPLPRLLRLRARPVVVHRREVPRRERAPDDQRARDRDLEPWKPLAHAYRSEEPCARHPTPSLYAG